MQLGKGVRIGLRNSLVVSRRDIVSRRLLLSCVPPPSTPGILLLLLQKHAKAQQRVMDKLMAVLLHLLRKAGRCAYWGKTAPDSLRRGGGIQCFSNVGTDHSMAP